MKTISNKPARMTLGLLAVAMMVACQKNNHLATGAPNFGSAPGALSGATGGNSSSLTGNGNKQQGTTDGGGGNGTKGKVYEYYAIDPTTKPAFVSYLKPIFDNLQRQNKALSGTNDIVEVVSAMIPTKTWFLAPMSLKPIDKDILGITFSKDGTQQLAVQTSREIWIDSRLNPDLITEAQAELILHEIVMNNYLLKFQTFSQICSRVLETTTGAHSDCDDSQALDLEMPPVKFHPLDKADYENIRRVTDWLMRNGAQASLKQVYDKFYDNGFDKRLFDYHAMYESVNDDTHSVALKGDEVVNIFERTKALNMLPTECRYVELNQEVPCQIEIAAAPSDDPKDLSAGIIRVKSADGLKTLHELKYVVSVNTEAEQFYVGNHKSEYFIFLGQPDIIKSPKIGDKTWEATLVVAPADPEDKTQFKLVGLSITPEVVTDIKQQSNYLECSATTPVPSSLDDDRFFVGDATVYGELSDWLRAQIHDSPNCIP